MKFDPETMESRQIHELFVGCVTPRPIAFVSTVSPDGINNLAPFSFFTMVALNPALAGFSIGRRRGGSGAKKDTLVNIEATGEFVINAVTEAIAEPMNRAAGDYPREVDEFREAGLTPLPSDTVRPPRVAESPVAIECRLERIMEFGTFPRMSNFVVGRILRVFVRDDVMENGVIRPERIRTIGRLGSDFYCRTQQIFEMKRPVVSPK